MANNTLGTGVLVLKANATQLEQGLDRAAAKTKSFEKQTSSFGSSMKLLSAGLAALGAVRLLSAHGRRMEEEQKRVQTLMDSVANQNEKLEGQRLGIIPSDVDIAKIKEGADAWSGWGARLDKLISATHIDSLLSSLSKGIDETLGVKQKDPAAEKEFLKRQQEIKAEQEALTKAVKDFDAELTKNAATIGMTAGEVKLYDLALKKVNTSGFKARLLANDVKAFEFELRKSIVTFGMTGEEIKRFEIKQRGATDAMLRMIDKMIMQRTEMEKWADASFDVEDPIVRFTKAMEILQERVDRGKISWDTYVRSVAKATDEFIALKQVSDDAEQKRGGSQQLRQGTRETAEFLINARANMRGANAQLDELKKQAAIQAQIRDNGAALIDLWKATPSLKMEKIDLQ